MTTDSHKLAVVSGPAVVFWDCFGEEKQSTRRSNSNHEDDNDKEEDDDNDDDDIVTRYPHGQGLNLSCMAWNHNRMILASATDASSSNRPNGHNSIDLMMTGNGETFDTFQHDDANNANNVNGNNRPSRPGLERHNVVNSLSFAAGSRYLISGDASGAVSIYDLKKKMRVRQYLHQALPSLQVGMDASDTLVLSMATECLFVYSLKQTKLLGTLVPRQPSGQFTRFHVSTLNPHLLAIGTLGGEVLLYDLSPFQPPPDGGSIALPSKPVLPMKSLSQEHTGPVTGLSFSRFNPNLLVSGGADGNVFLWNVSTGKMVQQVCALENAAVKSLSLHADGMTLAIGCESGHVLLYELLIEKQRLEDDGEAGAIHLPRLVGTLQFDGPIEQVEFAPVPRSKSRSPQEREQQQQQQKAQQENIYGASNGTTTTISSNNKSFATPFDLTAPTPAKFKMPPQNLVGKDNDDDDDDDDSHLSSVVNHEFAKTAFSSESSLLPQSYAGPSSPSAVMKPKQQQQPPPPTFQTPLMASTSSPPKHQQQQQQQPSLPPPPPPQQKSATSSISAHDVREIVQDEVENLGDKLEEQLRSLHLDMIAQFHKQSQEMNKILSDHMTAIASLQDENRALREENDRLRYDQQ